MNFEPTKTFLLKKWSECHWDEFSKLIRKVFVILLSCLLTCFCNFLKAFEKIECLDSGDFDFKWIERLFHPSIFVNRVLSNLYICNMKYHVKEIRSESMLLVGTQKCQMFGEIVPLLLLPFWLLLCGRMLMYPELKSANSMKASTGSNKWPIL